jgi:hypothetical protein
MAAKVFDVFINGRYVDSIEAPSLRIAKVRAAIHFNVPVTVKVRRNG